MASIKTIHRLIDESVPGGMLSWVKRTTLKNAHSEFIQQLADTVPENESPVAIAFDIFNAHANDRAFNALCTDMHIYLDDPSYRRSSDPEGALARIPLSEISEFSFIEGSLATHELKFVQQVGGLAVHSVWRQLVISGAMFKSFVMALKQQLQRERT